MLAKPCSLHTMVEISEQKYFTLIELADCYANLGRYAEAGPTYERAIQLRPDKHEAYLALGQLAVQANQLEVAAAALRRCCEIKPDCAEALAARAVLHQKRQEYPAAFDMYLRSLEIDADNLLALLGLFQTSVKMGSFGKIIQYLELYLDTHPDDTSVLFCLATLYGKEGKYEDSRDLLRRLLRIEPDKAEAVELLAKLDGLLQPSGA